MSQLTPTSAPTKLPKLSKTLAEIRGELFKRMDEVQEDYIAKGYLPSRLNLNKGIARGMIELFAWGIWQLYQLLEKTMQEAVPKNASGDWLDIHAEQVGILRKESQKAYGMLSFSRADMENLERNIVIPSGRIVKTLPDGEGEVYRYVTMENAVISKNDEFCLVPIESESFGRKSNASPLQICELVTPVEGVGKVSNLANWLLLEASDTEKDLQLHRRYALAFSSQAGMTRAAYESIALSVAGVEDVYISDKHPRGEGTLDIIVQGANGVPTDALLVLVRAAVADNIVINDDVLVKAPELITINIDFTIELLNGDEKDIKAKALDYIKKLFSCDPSVPYFGIGKDVILSRMEYGIINLYGVKRIIWTSPSLDIVISASQMAGLGTVNINTLWVNNE